MRTVRIFISSPGDVIDERERARQVVDSLRRRYSERFLVKPILWEDLPLQAHTSFQQGIDLVLSREHGIDIAVFILWSRLGSPLGALVRKSDGSEYRSGTERELDLMLEARKQSGGDRPALMVYTRRDDTSFDERLRGKPLKEKEEIIAQKKLLDQFIAEEFRDGSTGHNLRAYHSFDRPVTFCQRLRVHLTELLDELAGGGLSQCLWDVTKQGPPFLGLEAFQPQHTDVFFGRESETLEAHHALREQARNGCAFLLLSGSSGSGKSSLARAGVLPAIAENELDEQVTAWLPVIVTPTELGPQPLLGLMRRLMSDDTLPELREDGSTGDDLADEMRTHPEKTVRRWLKHAVACATVRMKGNFRILLLIDQIEELFTNTNISESARTEFLGAVEALARNGSFWVLGTVRSDFIAKVQAEPSLVRMMEGLGALPVLAPDVDALRRLIEEPARLAGLHFEEREGQRLSDKVLADAAKHAELLPLLEFVLRELFEQRSADGKLRWDVYDALGGVEGALAKQAEDVFANIPLDAQVELGWVLKNLVSLRPGNSSSDVEPVRQRVALSRIEERSGASQLVAAFVRNRLFTTTNEPSTGEAIVTVAHESLLRVWQRSAGWIQANKDFLRTRDSVSARMREGSRLFEGEPLLASAGHHLRADREGFTTEQQNFIESSQKEALRLQTQRDRLRRRVVGALGTLASVALVAAALAVIKWNQASWEKIRAEEGSARAAENAKIAGEEAVRAEANAQRAMTSAMEASASKKLAEEKTAFAESSAREAESSLKRAELEKTKQDALLLNASRESFELALSSVKTGDKARAYASRAITQYPKNSTALSAAINLDFGLSSQGWMTRSILDTELKAKGLHFSANGDALITHDSSMFRIVDTIPRADAPSTPANEHFEKVLAACPFDKGRWLIAGMKKDGKLAVIDSATGKELFLRQQTDFIDKTRFSADGKYLALVCDGDNSSYVVVFDLSNGKTVYKGDVENGVFLEFSVDGRFIGVPGDETVQVVDLNKGAVLKIKSDFTTCIAFSPDGSLLAAPQIDGVAFTNISTKKVVQYVSTNRERENRVRCIEFSPDGIWCALGDDSGHAKLIHVASHMEARTMKFESRVTSLAFSPDSNWLAAGSEDSSVGLIQVIGDNEAKIALSSKVAALAFSPDGRWLAAQSTDGLIRVLEPIGIDRGATSPSWVNILNRVSTNNQMIFSPDGKWVAVTGDPNVVILETISAREIAKGGPGGMASFSPDSQLLAIGNGQSKSIQVVESSSGNLKHRLLLDGTPTAVAVSNGCRLMAVAIELSEDNFKVCIYEPSKPEPVRTWDYKVGADRLQFSSGARELFVGRGDGPEADASIIDLETGQDFSCTAAAFNLTGRLMAVCVGETVDIMELATGQELSHITINGKVQSICFSNDDRYLFALATSSTPRLSNISGDVPASVRIVNLASGSEICSVTASLSFPSPHRRGWIESSGSNIVHSGKDFPLVISQHWLSRESSDVPDYFAKLLQLQSGLIVDRRLRSRNDSEWLDLWNSFIDDAKNAPSEPLYFHSILQWWSTAPELKAVSPWVNMPLREAIGQSLMGAWEPWTPFECAERAPWHPLTPVCLARWYGMLSWSPDDRKFEVINPVFLARLTLNRLRVADATLYGKDVLASYAKTATKIMVELNEAGGGKILAKEIEEMRAMSWEDDNGKQ